MPRAPLALLVLLVVPPAAAAAPLAGELSWGDDARVEGRLHARAAEAILDLSADAARGLRFAWAGAEGYHRESTEFHGPAGPAYRDDPANASLAWGAGAMEVLSCDADCRVLAWVEGGADGVVGLRGNASGPLARETGARTEGGRVGPPGAGATVLWHLPEARLAPPPLDDAAPTLEGRVRLFVWGARVRVEDAAGARELWTGARSEPAAAAGVPLMRTRDAELVLVLEEASVAPPPASAARLEARALDLALSGEARADAATGWVALDGRRVDLHEDPVTVAGPGILLRVAPRDLRGQDVALAGEADRVTVAGGTLRERPPPSAAAAPVAVGGGLLALLLAWRALVPLYSRLTRGVLLENPNRARVYEHVRANPGTHVAAISRATGIGRVVAQHHLRMLEAHRLVVRRQGPKLLTYYAADGVPPGEDVAARDVLRDDARRRVGLAVAKAEAGATTRDLAASLGMSRRLVDYHLARLEAAGLVRREGFLPARFLATKRLESALASRLETFGSAAATDGMENG